MTQTLLHQLLATAEKLDGPEAWIHLCVTAAEEAASAVYEGPTGSTLERLYEWLAEPVYEGAVATALSEILAMPEGIALELKARICGGKAPAQVWDELETALQAQWRDAIPGEWQDAMRGGARDGKPNAAAPAAASAAYRANLPAITNRRSVQSFVACVAAGVLRGYIATKDANQLLYVAQVALSAFPKRAARKGGK